MDSFASFNYLLLLRLAAAVVLGGIIGFERGGNKHEAGLRTHIIVCLASAAIMVVSECLTADYSTPSEIMRMGAQIISGIGFLGAGSIIVDGNKVRGITTAAGLWATACVGIAVGSGYYVIAMVMVALMMFAMLGLRTIANRLQSGSQLYRIKICLERSDDVKNIFQLLYNENVEIKTIRVETNKKNDMTELVLEACFSKKGSHNELVYQLSQNAGITEFVEQ